ncbi:YceI family protein [Arcticibacterium luteifluviistationis]|uniref:YceI family protein n=1 Tax=Arcticibacterium luteifluviistationis TaxID=1784714 RepID=A0A2Z4GIF0_9BACT|nr:YceI family protein [Arcticibacterium luteifluviistationis]AWW00865.1 YceI family protein [Arcticibacterium luteifluviistationis]
MKSTLILMTIALGLSSFTELPGKLISKKSKVSFFSHTAVEDIKAVNFKTVGTLEEKTGDVVFSVPMQSFEFEKSLMQKHFNSPKFLDTKTNPKAKFVGKITNLNQVNFEKDGKYAPMVVGSLTINGVTQKVSKKGEIVVSGGKITTKTKFDITLADYKIAFSDGKPSTNIAKDVTIEFEAEF